MRLSAVQGARRAGHERALAPCYPASSRVARLLSGAVWVEFLVCGRICIAHAVTAERPEALYLADGPTSQARTLPMPFPGRGRSRRHRRGMRVAGGAGSTTAPSSITPPSRASRAKGGVRVAAWLPTGSPPWWTNKRSSCFCASWIRRFGRVACRRAAAAALAHRDPRAGDGGARRPAASRPDPPAGGRRPRPAQLLTVAVQRGHPCRAAEVCQPVGGAGLACRWPWRSLTPLSCPRQAGSVRPPDPGRHSYRNGQ
jgi:hypothetical protein